jgi:hypothetical protein
LINGGTFVVPAALGNKVIHPFSDFLLHDVGTGGGIIQNGGPSTANKLRTPPLWGLRTRTRHMQDGLSVTPTDASCGMAGLSAPLRQTVPASAGGADLPDLPLLAPFPQAGGTFCYDDECLSFE